MSLSIVERDALEARAYKLMKSANPSWKFEELCKFLEGCSEAWLRNYVRDGNRGGTVVT